MNDLRYIGEQEDNGILYGKWECRACGVKFLGNYRAIFAEEIKIDEPRCPQCGG